MNRPKEYDRDVVLHKATALFWEKGYEATSVCELEKVTGINKNSLYNEFGNKNKLFCLCIDDFMTNFCRVEEILTKKPLGLNNIEEFFKYKMEVYNAEYGKGCLVFNTVTEEESVSKEANKKVNNFLQKMKIQYSKVLTAAKKNKELRKNADINALADYMCNFTYGFVNLGMKTMKKKDLKNSIDLALKVLKG